MYYIFPLRKNVAYKNLQIVFKNKSKNEINKIILKTYMHYSLIMTEFIRNSSSKINKRSYSLSEDSLAILNSKDGIILMTAHIGNWEMILPIIGNYKKIMAVVKEQTNTGGNNFFHKARSFHNVELISKKSSKRKMLEALNDNFILGLASDQNAKFRGVYVDFFNKPTSIPKGAGYFHYHTKNKIAICFCMLNEKLNYDFKIEYLDIEKYNIEQKEDIIVKINEIYTKRLENEILKHPEQYFWFHRKWDKSIYV